MTNSLKLEVATRRPSHVLRKTAITTLSSAGVPLEDISDFAGHANPAMTASVYMSRDFEGDKSALAAVFDK